MTFAAAAIGIGTAVGGSLITGAIEGGGGSSQPSVQTNQNGSIGQGIGNILAGGLSTALGVQGLAGGNLNQLQSGAAAANPFGSQSNQYYGILQQLLGGGIAGTANQNATTQTQLLQYLEGTAGINTGAQNLPTNVGTNVGALLGGSQVSTPGQQATAQQLINNPTQLINSLQGGGTPLPSSIQSILSQNPYSLTSGEQFQETQGLANLNRSLAQTGQIGSGNQYAAAEQYGQNFASQAVQQNITNLLGAQSSANQTSTTNQGIQSLVNSMGQNEFGNNLSLAQLLSGQQQASFGQQLSAQQLQQSQQQGTFSNQLAGQQLQSTQQQNTQQNLQNLLTQLMGIGGQQTGALESLLGPLLTATQASSSSPATAGGILSNLGVANQASGSNVASGLAGLGQGIGQLGSGIGNALSFGSGGGSNSGSENIGASSTSTPDDLISSFVD